MKKFLLTISLLSVLFFYNNINIPSSYTNILAESKAYYQNGLRETHHAIKALVSLTENAEDSNQYKEKLQKQLIETRLKFKKIEFLLDYFDPELVYYQINGAPLPKLEKHVPEINVFEPNGLQTLDEMIFADEPEFNKIHQLAVKLESDFSIGVKFQNQRSFEHRYIIESMRYGLIRLYNLGLTGFDTPGSVNGVEEAVETLNGMIVIFYKYGSLAKDPAHYQKIIDNLEACKNYLEKNDDFESLDRYQVLIDFINPLYADLLDFQKGLGVELRHEVDPTPSAHNYLSTSLFASDFLDKSFYSKISPNDLKDPKKLELGKTLFYDPVLSKSNSMSCASCHNPDLAFTDGKKTSLTKEQTAFPRNAPTLINSVYYNRYFLDMRETGYERQVKHVVMDKHEFNLDFIELAERLKKSEEYVDLFDKAYGKQDKYGISSWSISNAIGVYVASLSGFDSPFDEYVNNGSKDIPESVRKGYNLFMGKAACGTCHFAPTFSGNVPPFYFDSESEVLGVLVDYDTLNPVLDNDPGRINNSITQEEAPHYLRSFKTTTVRNASKTAPYMHNGSIESFEELMDFYNRGGGAGMGLDVPYQTLPDAPLDLTQDEIENIIAFMESLDNYEQFIEKPSAFPKFEDPFLNERNIDK